MTSENTVNFPNTVKKVCVFFALSNDNQMPDAAAPDREKIFFHG